MSVFPLLRARALWLSPYPEDMTAATRDSYLALQLVIAFTLVIGS